MQEDVFIEFCNIAVADIAQRVKVQQESAKQGGASKTDLKLRIEYLVDGDAGSLQLVSAEDDLELQLSTLFSGNEKCEVFVVLSLVVSTFYASLPGAAANGNSAALV